MSNKVYKEDTENSNKINLKHELIIIASIFIVTYAISFIPLPWSIYKPGGAINIDEKLTNKKYSSKGNINMSYLAFAEGTISSLIVGLILPSWDIVSDNDVTYDGQTMKETEIRERIDMYKAISDATYLAYEKAGVPLEITSQNFYVTSVIDKDKSEIQVGDIILSYDGIMMSSTTSFKEYIETKEEGSIIELKVLRDDKKKNVTSTIFKEEDALMLGVGIEVTNNYPKGTVTYVPDDDESGPSCGLMLTLSIYNSIIEEDLTNGKKVCGTGTIASNGEVGVIGGIKYKLIGSESDGCDIFFVPEENYQEGLKIMEKNELKMDYYQVRTFDEALAILHK